MQQRGRKSTANMSVVAVGGGERYAAPDYFSPEEREEWRSIIQSLPADHFRPADLPLLAAFCVASVFYKDARDDMKVNGMWLRDPNTGRRYVNPCHTILTSQASAMAQMSVKLRLCPSSKSAKSAESKPAAKPWEATG